MNTPFPSVGRIVHYVDPTFSQHLAAIITRLESQGYVDLCIFKPDGLLFLVDVRHSMEPVMGTWHWPERV